ncbi:esterase family protein [Mycobacterium paragordonae]|uniref:alpha/beta hydrolase n=1 Tax=Mycobacterium paragordonae TaxID=1389713 RepID=UPI00105E4FF7|nr:alpha/beta hydrolase-fold protein [Mycobacterium paragordonae]TDK95861.1 esterase family protein [Mycobacterium paragordonae]
MIPDGIPANNNEPVTASTPHSLAPAASADGFSTQAFSHTSLMHGWVPITVQVVTGVALLLAIGWRTRAWRLRWLPLAALAGGAAAYGTRAFVSRLSTEPVPGALWLWAGLAGMAVTVLVLGWRSAHWWRRGIALLAVPMCLFSTALTLNMWVGYFPTVQAAWGQLTSGPLPDQTDPATVTAMKGKGVRPPHGSVVPVVIPSDASHFKHRGELVYLPPAWFASDPPPRLPTVMMIGGQFNTPADWARAGNAVRTADAFAAAHDGNAPVLVFVDSGGAFNNDTECVNGRRGNAADHLTKDVVPFMVSKFGSSPEPANWGIAGWSMGGTCAVDLTVMHPGMFSAFVDVAGDLYPNAGNKEETISRLFGGNTEAWAAFDPTTVMTRHGPYTGVAGWFAIPAHRELSIADTPAMRLAGRDAAANPSNQTAAANALCALGRSFDIDCAVIPQPGKHDWPFADQVFATALPWLAGRLGTPGVPRIPLPGTAAPPAPTPPANAQVVAAGR